MLLILLLLQPPLTGMYSIVVPGVKGRTNSGNDGLNPGAASEIKNRAVAVAVSGLVGGVRIGLV